MTSELAPLMTILIAGFFGSWHCAAMCGPIAIALGRRGRVWPYHLGRALSYISAGVLAGHIGRAILVQPSFAFRVGSFLFLSFLFLLTLRRRRDSSRTLNAWEKFIYARMRKNQGAFTLGALSVLLPCGWLWTFILAASSTGSPWAGALVMASLWISALPAFALLTSYFRVSLQKTTLPTRTWASYILATVGIYSLWSHFFWF